MYFLMLILCCICISKVRGGMYLFIFLFIAFLISSKIYPMSKAVGSWWCVSAILGPLIKLALPTGNLNDIVL